MCPSSTYRLLTQVACHARPLPQVVGVSDFGFDLDSCFLHDPVYPDLATAPVSSLNHVPASAFPPTAYSGVYGDFELDAYESQLRNVTIFQPRAHAPHRKVRAITDVCSLVCDNQEVAAVVAGYPSDSVRPQRVQNGSVSSLTTSLR